MKKRKWLLPWICVGCLITGIFLSFYDTYFYTNKGQLDSLAICFSKKDQIQAICILCILAALFVYGIYTLRGKYAWSAGIVLTVAGVFIVFTKRKAVVYGIRFVSYLYKNRMAAYMHTVKPSIQIWKTIRQDVFWFEMLIGFLLLLYAAIFVLCMHSKGYLLLFDVAALSLGMIFGKTPGVVSVVWLVLGSVGLFVWMSREERGVKGVKKVTFWQKEYSDKSIFVITALIGMVLLSVSYFYAVRFEKHYFKDAQEARDQNETMVQNMANTGKNLVQTLFHPTIVDNTGDLSNQEPKYTERTVLKVNLPRIPDQPVYLRGFTGDTYTNGKWKAGSYREVEKKAASHFQGFENIDDDTMLEGIWDMGFQIAKSFDGMYQNDMDDNGSITDERNALLIVHSMHIEYVGGGALSKYAYLPYFSSATGASSDEDNGNWSEKREHYLNAKGDNHCVKENNQLQIGCLLLTENEEKLLYQTVKTLKGDKDALLPFTYTAEFYDVYQKLAKQYYTQMPKGRLQSFYQIAKQAGDLKSTWSKAEFVKKYLRNNASYSMNLDPVPKGADYAEYFLLVQKKGYCEHFATAGTLLLRACGVPARYVTGYRVDPEDFKIDPDGGYTAEVKDSDAHAWSEVYIKNMGWVCKDMTPAANAANNLASVKTLKKNASSLKKNNTKVNNTKEEKKQTIQPTATTVPTASAAKDQSTVKAGTKEHLWQAVLICIVVWIVILLCMMILVIRLRQMVYQRSMMREIDLRKKEQKRLQSTYRFVRMAGIREKKNSTDSEWIQEVAQKMPSKEMEEVVQKLAKQIEGLAFSAKVPTQEDWGLWDRQLQWIEKKIYQEVSVFRKILLKIFGLYSVQE